MIFCREREYFKIKDNLNIMDYCAYKTHENEPNQIKNEPNFQSHYQH